MKRKLCIAWIQRTWYFRRTVFMKKDTEPGLFQFVEIEDKLGSRKYIYLGRGMYLPTKKKNKSPHFLKITMF